MQEITPKDPAEAVALYRAQIVGALCVRQLDRGELGAALAELSRQRFRAPRAHSPQSYSVATLERWYYAYKEGGLDALRPQARADKGRGRDLTEPQRELLMAIRTEHPTASVSLILRTLVSEGRLQAGAISESTVRRFYQERGLDRRTLGAGGGGKMRLRWQAERPMALWQGDVCHGSPLVLGESSMPVRVHALLDDASRYIVAIEAMASLAILETALDIAGVALASAWPELHDFHLARDSPESHAALDILRCAKTLLGAVNHYRLLLATAEARELDFPF